MASVMSRTNEVYDATGVVSNEDVEDQQQQQRDFADEDLESEDYYSVQMEQRSPGDATRGGSSEDFDSAKSKKRRKQSKPVRLTNPVGESTVKAESGMDLSKQLQAMMWKVERQDEDGGSPEGTPELPLNLCFDGQLPSNSPGRAGDDQRQEGPDSPTAALQDWQSKLQGSLPFFTPGKNNWPQEMLGDVKPQANLLGQFPGQSANLLPNFFQPSPFFPFLLPPTTSSPAGFKNGAGVVTNGNNKDGMPIVTKSMIIGSGPPGGPPIRIFNPEAYCHLCNKEFCNKYFLKTHKANKHGIYSGEGTPPAKTNSNSSDSTAPPKNPFLPVPFMPTPVATPTAAPLPPFKPVQSSSKKGGPTPIDPTRPINPDAFCVLCQKEFCNKYFLKRHKLKIHGIIPADGTDVKSPSGSSTKEENGVMKSPAKVIDPKDQANKQKVLALKTAVPPMHPVGNSGYHCKLCNVVCESKAQLDMHLQAAHDVAMPLEAQRSVETSTREDELGYVRSIPKEIFQLVSKDSLMDKLKDQGVVNPELICHVCGKEFAEPKYLLLHQSTKHGVQLARSPEDRSVQQRVNFEKEMMMAEQQLQWKPTDNGSLDLRKSPELQCNDVSRRQCEASPKSAESGEVMCNDCGRPFLNSYWLEIHQKYFHPSTHEESLNDALSRSVESATEDLRRAMPSKAETNSQAAQVDSAGDLEKLQSMLVELNNTKVMGQGKENCEVCSMKFENPALLRIHLIEEHGIIPGLAHSDKMVPMPSAPDLGQFLPGGNSMLLPEQQESFFLCPICKNGFPQRELLMRHLHTAHSLPPQPAKPLAPPVTPKSNKSGPAAKESTAPKSEKKTTWSTSRSYCQICNKELCNKYFMKTHMMKMHGINVDINGTSNGGVMCDICNKVLCSKYFLKVHKQNTHGIPDPTLQGGLWNAGLGLDGLLGKDMSGPEGNLLFKMSEELQRACGPAEAPQPPKRKVKVSSSKPVPTLRQPNTAAECPRCPAAFLDKMALQIHMAKVHVGESLQEEAPRKDGDKPPRVYYCSLCKFSTNSLPTLLAHQNCHTDEESQSRNNSADQMAMQSNSPPASQGAMQCPVCFMWLPSFQVFHQHILSHRMDPFMAPFLSQFNLPPQTVDSMGLQEQDISPEQFLKVDFKAEDQERSDEEGQLDDEVVQLQQQQELLRRIFQAGADQGQISKIVAAMQGDKQLAGNLLELQNERGLNGSSASRSRSKPPRFRCSVCKKGFKSRTVCLSHIHSFHNPRNKSTTYIWSESAWRKRRIFRCSQCVFSSRFMFKVKAHFRESHRPKSRRILRFSPTMASDHHGSFAIADYSCSSAPMSFTENSVEQPEVRQEASVEVTQGTRATEFGSLEASHAFSTTMGLPLTTST